jgi:NAD(P)-dependent dehydrogenase (short-subunit alcohol dehydrogenase family)
VNHLAHFFLTDLLRARLTASAPARIINVSSAGHHMAQRGMRFEDLQTEQRYAGMEVYARSKLANVLFTRQLSDRISATGVTVNALHPGLVRSGFGMDGDMTGLMGWGNRALRPFEISSTAGARTSVFLATSPEVEGKSGLYWVRSKPGHMSRMARRDDQAQRLWTESERLLASAGFPAGP